MVSLHLRLKESFDELLHYAQDLSLPFFQCFLLAENKQYIKLDQKLINSFAPYKNYYKKLYLHASYYINLSSPKAYNIVMKELYWAKKLGFTHFILHPGAATSCDISRDLSIKIIGQTLNQIIMNSPDITILLENTAHGKRSIGGSFEELAHIRSYLQHPEELKFCIDTAHVHSFGYDISTYDAQNIFLHEIDKLINLKSIELIHLNDTAQPLGSKLDKHAYIGEGVLGLEALKSFVNHPKLFNTDIILELPNSNKQIEINAINMVLNWKTF